MQCADQAMYRAKNAGRGRVRVHRPEHTDTSTRTTPSVTSTLQGALERDEYRLYFQPQVDATGSLFGVEALLRWQSGSELVAPGDFIPMLEENGAIVQVGRWVLRRALGQLRQWWSQGVSVPRMAVNISPVQLETPDLCDVVTDALRTFGIPPSALELEVTERVVMSNHAACSTNIERIRASGVRLALDDFGTGYASLAYLHRYPMDTLKVDQSFVQDVTTNAKSASIVGSIIDLGRRLNLVTIAEGVETTAQAEFLRREGCAVLQGYLYDRPRPGNVAPLSDTTLNSPTIA
ncbi:MAG: GGDEF domain-containing phosphodiesterase [Myxococcales bacterium]|nr:GGDEF domain-containing phosphodiesterase [Myxococcales bacterium]